jgi:hypothetical protein
MLRTPVKIALVMPYSEKVPYMEKKISGSLAPSLVLLLIRP